MEAIDLVFSDVDGTLVGSDHHAIPQSAAIMQEIAQHVTLCLVSARSPTGLTPIQRDLGFDGPLACYSGAYVLDHEGTPLFSAVFPLEEALQIKAEIARLHPQTTVGMYGFEHWVVDDRRDPRIAHEEMLVQTTALECSQPENIFGNGGVHKLLVMGEPESIRVIEGELGARYPQLNVVRSSDILCEIMSREASKSHAVEVLCERYASSRARAIAFGDGPNDIDMLQAVDRSFAMANAEASVKAAATEVLPYTNEQCGVARMLAKLILKRSWDEGLTPQVGA
ncbi:MAG: HAD family hydrolase [Coriobacteriales bacterium]|nr:HAD family hydrolase [Coriobacteriales bacterium]